MSSFVEQCRKEWSRLGVPEAEANEMAALHRHPLPPLFVNPSGRHPVDFGTMVPPSLQPAGLVLLLLGLGGLGAILWIWRPWSQRRGGPSGFDQNVGMPNFL